MALAPSWFPASFNSLVTPSVVFKSVISLNELSSEKTFKFWRFSEVTIDVAYSKQPPQHWEIQGGNTQSTEIWPRRFQFTLNYAIRIHICMISTICLNVSRFVNGIWIKYEGNNHISWEPKEELCKRRGRKQQGDSKGDRRGISNFHAFQLSSNAI